MCDLLSFFLFLFPPSLPLSFHFFLPIVFSFLIFLYSFFLSEVPITLRMKFKLLISIEGKFTNYKISHFKANNLVAFSTFSVLCKHHLYLVSKYFHHQPPQNPKPIKQLLPISLLPQPLANTNLLPDSMDLYFYGSLI